MRHGDIIIKQLGFHQDILESEFQSLTANFWISLAKARCNMAGWEMGKYLTFFFGGASKSPILGSRNRASFIYNLP